MHIINLSTLSFSQDGSPSATPYYIIYEHGCASMASRHIMHLLRDLDFTSRQSNDGSYSYIGNVVTNTCGFRIG
jgi:hypothetical protein